jgi:hypothetical protein
VIPVGPIVSAENKGSSKQFVINQPSFNSIELTRENITDFQNKIFSL